MVIGLAFLGSIGTAELFSKMGGQIHSLISGVQVLQLLQILSICDFDCILI